MLGRVLALTVILPVSVLERLGEELLPREGLGEDLDQNYLEPLSSSGLCPD